MAGERRLIGVCLSQAHTYLNSGYLSELDRAARPEGYRVAVFNTALDLYWYRQGSEIARSIFSTIDYDQFAALVILYENLRDPQLLNRIVREAAEHQVPVICLGAVWEGCYSILYDYYEPYKELIRRVIRERGVRNPFCISGIEGEANSVLRLRCCREAMEEEGIAWSPDRAAYGFYCEDPARIITEKLIRNREEMPDAIFCANDYMALGVCQALRGHGIRVPEDVKVTGFDGLPAAELASPQLTTCSMNLPELAERTVRFILELKRGEVTEPVRHHPYLPLLSESCGWPRRPGQTPEALSLFRRLEDQDSQENHLFHMVERVLMQDNMRDMLLLLAKTIPEHSAVYLNQSLVISDQGTEFDLTGIEPVLIRIAHQSMDQTELIAEQVPIRNLTADDLGCHGLTLLTAVHSSSTVFGCFAAHTETIGQHNQTIKRISDVLNLTFTIVQGNIRQRRLRAHLEDSAYLDPLTGLENLRGLNRWFDRFAAEPENHERCMGLSVYSIYRYDYLYETYGIVEAEEIVQLVSDSLRAANMEALKTARINDHQFAVVNTAPDPEGLGETIDRCARLFFSRMDAFNASGGKSYYLEVNAGCTTMDAGWQSTTLGNLIQLATGEMYLNRLRSTPHEVGKDPAAGSEGKYNSFKALLRKGLFHFEFQPIVDARSGRIYAYEALMRTEPEIGMTPTEILAIAREYNHLDEIERLTFFGVMERYTRFYDAFHQNKLFINTIPGHFLNREDCEKLKARYEKFLDCFVFELTEQDTTSDEELRRLKELHKAGGKTQIAIDDYGTGHSNIVNLLRYAPQIIKIDRDLISDIQNDSNKRLFVRNTVEFAHQNGIQALAEGVETSGELRCVLECGVDLIQGFYTGDPTEEPVAEIPEEIRGEIVEERLRLVRENAARQVYQAKDGETVRLLDLALQYYSEITVSSGEVTLIGEAGHIVNMTVRVKDGACCRLNLDRACLQGQSEAPIQLGRGSRTVLRLIGDSELHKEGIQVPETAELLLTGSGSLTVHCTRNYGCSIGAGFNDAYGTIEADMDGQLSIRATGDKTVCLGGGRSAGRGILLHRGSVDITAGCISALGVGSASGPAAIRTEKETRLKIHLNGNNAVGMGTIHGSAEMTLGGEASVTVESERGVALGAVNGRLQLALEGGKTDAVIRTDVGVCVGSVFGHTNLRAERAELKIHGEGNRVCGIGNLHGDSDALLTECAVSGGVLAGERLLWGNERSHCEIRGGSILLDGVPYSSGHIGEAPESTEYGPDQNGINAESIRNKR